MSIKPSLLIKVLLSIILVIVLIGGMLLASVSTNLGSRLLINLASKFIPGQLKYTQIKGSLINSISLINPRYRYGDISSQADAITLTWQAANIFSPAIKIDQLQATNLVVSMNSQTYRIDQFLISGDIAKQATHFNLQAKLPKGNISCKGAIFKGNQFFIDINAQQLTIQNFLIPKFSLQANGNQQQQQINIATTINQLPIALTWHSQQTKSGLNGSGIITLPQQPNINFSALLPHYQLTQLPNKQQPVQAKLSWRSSQLDFLSKFNPQISQPRGRVNIELNIAGVIAQPIISGNLQLADGGFILPLQEITVSDFTVDAKLNKNEINYHASAKSSGTINLSGTTKLDKSFTSSMRLTGKVVLASNTNQLKLFLSPDLFIQIADNKINVNGTIEIPQAIIAPVDFSSTENLSSDVVFVDTKRSTPTQSWPLAAEITLIAGKDIHIKVKGVSGKLTGKIKLNSQPSAPIIANGELDLKNGQFDAYGQNLQIDTGQLIFLNSPITNPTVNVRATKTFKTNQTTFSAEQENLVVGLSMQGHLENPTVTLFSIPAGLSQAEILSFLILGQPLNSANPSSADLLFRAASALNIGGSASGIASVTNQLKQGLGLSQLGIETESEYSQQANTVTQNTSLVLGKYLSPKLYIQYSIGLFSPVNTLKLRYHLSKRWSVQTENSNIGTGADIMFTMSRE